MDFGVVLQTHPPAARVIDLAKRAEAYGFTHAWTFDSHLLWEEPFVIYSRILNETHKLVVGPLVTNPSTRDPTVIASLFATLNEMYGNRTICGIGRGDSAVRVINGRPAGLAVLREAIDVIRGLANGGEGPPIPSGPLHDATEIGRLVPTVMLFAQSDPPISHAPVEDSPEEALRVAIDAYGRTVGAALALLAAGPLEVGAR